jgi:hypothetical protein
MKLDLSARAISERLAQVSAMSDLATEKRLDAKLDLGAQGISARLAEVSKLRELCMCLERASPQKNVRSVDGPRSARDQNR